MPRFKAVLVLSPEELAQLTTFSRSRSVPAALSQRARIVLACAAGDANSVVARRFELTSATVGKWRGRFVKHRIAGLYDEIRPGRPRTIEDEQVASLIRRTLEKEPTDRSTRWSVRRVAKESGISKSSVHRYLRLFSVKSHRR
jgi:putative transposase